MAKAQGKKAAAAAGGKKSAAKKAVARVKSAASAAKKKVVPAKKAKPAKPAAPAKKKTPVAKKIAKAVKKVVAKVAAKPKKAAPAPAAKAKAAPKQPAPKAAPKPAPKPAPKAAPKAPPKAAPAPEVRRVVAPVVPPKPAAAPAPAPEEKKRGRRARPRVTSNGVPTAAWLSTEKPRPASFIPAPPRAEAPSAIAAPPASSDRLIRTEDLTHPAIRTVPVRIDVEQGQGRFHVIANPTDAQVRAGEAIEWDFRYVGGADFSVEEIVIEFDKPAPFAQAVYKTRKPGGARPHRQVTAGVTGAAGKTYNYNITAMTPFKTVLVTGKGSVTIV